MPRTLVMSVRYALRISVDDATEETPSAAYRSGSPEAVESGAAGIVAEAVLDVTSKGTRDVPTKGERTRLRRADPWPNVSDGRSSRERGRGRARCEASRAARASK